MWARGHWTPITVTTDSTVYMNDKRHRFSDYTYIVFLPVYEQLSVPCNSDYDLPNMLLPVLVLVRLSDILEVEHLVDNRPQLDSLDQAVHVFESTCTVSS